ncbi:MAG TPA: glycosyltransferase family 39 protein [Candidatus Angelobacter sp.]|nr:glycosyltransferase family 39 protein [Candidatus Angelobacter sp.]
MLGGVQPPPAEIVDSPLRVQTRATLEYPPARGRPLADWVYALAIFATLFHFIFAGRYGYFRDELYYAACGQHLAWGYVDHAPLIAWIARLSRTLLGNSLFALRFSPALAAAGKVILAGWMARELGGRRFAQSLAAVAVLVAPIYLTFDSFLSMNSFEPLFWMACAAILMRILNGGSEKLWLLFGAVAGVGILNKHSMLFFGSGVFTGLWFTSARREYARKWIWLGGAIAFLIFLPNLLWEIRNGFPTIALLHAVIGTKYTTLTPWQFIWQQTLLALPLSAPIWLAGLWCLFWNPTREAASAASHDVEDKTAYGVARARILALGHRFAQGIYAPLAWAYLVVLIEMIALHGKIYYLAPVYPMLLAAGAVWIESQLPMRTEKWLRPTLYKSMLIASLIVGGFIAAPLAMPILPVDAAVRYSRFWDVDAIHPENIPLGKLPQLFGDMYGWRHQVQAIAKVFDALPAADREQCAILALNYGEASAVDYLGPAYHLPPAISGHNQYGLWGPRGYTGNVVITIGYTEDQLRNIFGEVTLAARISPPYAIPEESNLPIYICRKPEAPLPQMWPSLRWLG